MDANTRPKVPWSPVAKIRELNAIEICFGDPQRVGRAYRAARAFHFFFVSSALAILYLGIHLKCEMVMMPCTHPDKMGCRSGDDVLSPSYHSSETLAPSAGVSMWMICLTLVSESIITKYVEACTKTTCGLCKTRGTVGGQRGSQECYRNGWIFLIATSVLAPMITILYLFNHPDTKEAFGLTEDAEHDGHGRRKEAA